MWGIEKPQHLRRGGAHEKLLASGTSFNRMCYPVIGRPSTHATDLDGLHLDGVPLEYWGPRRRFDNRPQSVNHGFPIVLRDCAPGLLRRLPVGLVGAGDAQHFLVGDWVKSRHDPVGNLAPEDGGLLGASVAVALR